jgi:hypothetical protein
LALVGGLISNALLNSYDDSANQPNVASKAESRNAVVSPAQLPIQPPFHNARPDTLTSQPKITAAAKPLSPIARRTTTFKPQVSRSHARVRSSTLVRKQTLTSQPKITAAAKPSSPIATTTFKPQGPRYDDWVRSSTPVRKQTSAFETAQPKKESNVTAILKKSGSILKKTVGILKRPFDR